MKYWGKAVETKPLDCVSSAQLSALAVEVKRVCDLEKFFELRGLDYDERKRNLCISCGSSDGMAVYRNSETDRLDRWHCFSCNESGDVIDFVRVSNGYATKGAAISELAGLFGISVSDGITSMLKQIESARFREAKHARLGSARWDTPNESMREFYDYYSWLTDRESVQKHADSLGVSLDSLLVIGAFAQSDEVLGFPMLNHRGEIVGIRFRGNGKKWSLRGGTSGLFVSAIVGQSPIGFAGRLRKHEPVYVVEGPTNTAAILTGIPNSQVIGRASSHSDSDLLSVVLRGMRVVFVADRDYAGIRGAIRCSESVLHRARSVEIIVPPCGFGDVRDWCVHRANSRAGGGFFCGWGRFLVSPPDQKADLGRFFNKNPRH